MCGRFAFYSPAEATAALFAVELRLEIEARFNIAPTQYVPVIRNDNNEGREFVMLRWGLVPYWAKDAAIGNRMINARAETVAEKPAYRAAYRKRRCLIAANGFYEWRKEHDGKTPYFITTADESTFAFAGLWESWKEPKSGEVLQTTTIITAAANDFMSGLYYRMPVICSGESGTHWLDGQAGFLESLPDITPDLKAWPVNRKVNNARNEGPDLTMPAGEVKSQR